ncbi:hypothetical protein AVEN_102928-1 [Araneus ventricosus]|uniref:Secreted protein n=1 Tax=Araneus ventricosus TaxID=182803 RepID=A0A4Y2MJM9_ARAVE|nr:hypothetical protein AVEN_102928-1 [Araneus ventricosus]
MTKQRKSSSKLFTLSSLLVCRSGCWVVRTSIHLCYERSVFSELTRISQKPNLTRCGDGLDLLYHGRKDFTLNLYGAIL